MVVLMGIFLFNRMGVGEFYSFVILMSENEEFNIALVRGGGMKLLVGWRTWSCMLSTIPDYVL